MPLCNLMEDAARREISRAQIWQWLRHHAALSDGRQLTPQLYDDILPQELARIESEVGAGRYESGHFTKAAELFRQMFRSAEFEEFLTLPAYELIG